jgi:hypothetical protein
MDYKIIDNFLFQEDFDKIKTIFFPENENDRKLTLELQSRNCKRS